MCTNYNCLGGHDAPVYLLTIDIDSDIAIFGIADQTHTRKYPKHSIKGSDLQCLTSVNEPLKSQVWAVAYNGEDKKLDETRIQIHDPELAKKHFDSIFKYLIALYSKNLSQTTRGTEIFGVIQDKALEKVERPSS